MTFDTGRENRWMDCSGLNETKTTSQTKNV